MTIYYDPSRIKMKNLITDEKGNPILDENGKWINEETGETLADHYKTCSGCAYCD